LIALDDDNRLCLGGCGHSDDASAKYRTSRERREKYLFHFETPPLNPLCFNTSKNRGAWVKDLLTNMVNSREQELSELPDEYRYFLILAGIDPACRRSATGKMMLGWKPMNTGGHGPSPRHMSRATRI
jgi:hypothetical protein